MFAYLCIKFIHCSLLWFQCYYFLNEKLFICSNDNSSLKHLLALKDSVSPSDNAIISQQILTLNLINTKLSHAYKGLDVEWEDSGKVQIIITVVIMSCDLHNFLFAFNFWL